MFDIEKEHKWNGRFLELAKQIAGWSKDPSTQAGAVIVDSDKRVISVGYNGFAKGVDDTSERYANRELKYQIILHAEHNAILFANRNLVGCSLYTWPFLPCASCAAIVIQVGICKCCAPILPSHLNDRWRASVDLSIKLLLEAGVKVVEVG